MKKIDDLDIPELDVYTKLGENRLRRYFEPAPGLFIAESPKVIERALDAGYEPVSFLVCEDILEARMNVCGDDPNLPERERGLRILDRCSGVPVYAAALGVLEKMTGFHLTLGMLCAMRRKVLPSAEEICLGSRRIAVLEEIVNPTNVGAIIRSAAALGIDGVLLTGGCSDPLYRRAARVSVGTVFQVPWTFMDKKTWEWPKTGLKKLRELGFVTAAMALENESLPIGSELLSGADRLALILGSEGEGLSEETITNCDHTVMIPMSAGVDSLNVAAAAAVAFWETGRK